MQYNHFWIVARKPMLSLRLHFLKSSLVLLLRIHFQVVYCFYTLRFYLSSHSMCVERFVEIWSLSSLYSLSTEIYSMVPIISVSVSFLSFPICLLFVFMNMVHQKYISHLNLSFTSYDSLYLRATKTFAFGSYFIFNKISLSFWLRFSTSCGASWLLV